MAAAKKTATKKGGSRKKADKPQAEVSAAPEARDDKPVMIASRVHPRLQYGLRLLSRVQGGTIAEALEWAINLAMRNTGIGAGVEATRLNKVVDKVWAQPSEARRIGVLFDLAPELLEFDERGAWNLVRRCDELWKGRYYAHEELPDSGDGAPNWAIVEVTKDASNRDRDYDETSPQFDLIEKHWGVIRQTGVLLARAGEIGETYTLDQIISGDALKMAGIETPY